MDIRHHSHVSLPLSCLIAIAAFRSCPLMYDRNTRGALSRGSNLGQLKTSNLRGTKASARTRSVKTAAVTFTYKFTSLPGAFANNNGA